LSGHDVTPGYGDAEAFVTLLVRRTTIDGVAAQQEIDEPGRRPLASRRSCLAQLIDEARAARRRSAAKRWPLRAVLRSVDADDRSAIELMKGALTLTMRGDSPLRDWYR